MRVIAIYYPHQRVLLLFDFEHSTRKSFNVKAVIGLDVSILNEVT